MTSRSSKSAGLGFLSAFTVANKNSTRGELVCGDDDDDDDDDDFKAVLARLKCALDGGLKLESRT